MKQDRAIKKLNNSGAFTLAELLAVILIISLIMITLAGGLTVVRSAYEKITLKAESATLMSTIITKVTDELRFASDVEVLEGGVVTFQSGIRGYRISIVNIPAGEGNQRPNIGIKKEQGGGTVQSLVSEKTISEEVAPEIKLAYKDGVFNAAVCIKKENVTVAEQQFYVTPVNN
ncbi:MAG: hypothetical protein Q4C14_08990 [Bacillota bacterium]|nr:hypothetical protein [Bacillota bacterium]